MATILIVDDDANLRLALSMTLTQQGHVCRLAETIEQAWGELQAQEPDLALLDLQLPDGSGLDLLERMRKNGLATPTVMMTAFGTVMSAVSAMKHGAEDFIEKPLSVADVCRLVNRQLRSRELVRKIAPAQQSGTNGICEFPIIAESPEMKGILALADKIAGLPSRPGIGLTATLILGETGTGKEVIARYIHHRSARPNGPFIHVNCTAIPDNLFEMELFGHEKGVFTDAKTRKQGLFEAADGGTLFLDEVGDLPALMQSKLLTAIETGRFRRLGATTEQVVDARIIAATNADLDEKQTAGRFRPDLYHRLRLFQIRLPALRERGDDLFKITEFLLNYFSDQLQRPVPALCDTARAAIRRYPWPGNVRELAHVLLQALVMSESTTLTAEALGLSIPPDTAASGLTGFESASLDFSFAEGILPLASVERRLLEAALKHADGNITEAARLVGLPRGTFRYRLERLGLV